MTDRDRRAMTPAEVESFIERAAWISAKSTEDVAPHQYVVRGWDRDDITEAEFWAFADWIRSTGRQETWTPPAEWVRRWGGRPLTNIYAYHGQHAYWFTWPRGRVPMLNREDVAIQEATPTRRPLPEQRRMEMDG